MPRIQEFYKGRRKRRNYALIPFVIALGLIVLLTVSFYALQQYAVITKEGVSVRIPLFDSGDNVVVDSQGNEVHEFERVETQLVFDEPDYSRIRATAGRYLSGVKAIFVPYTDITEEKLGEYTARLSRGNALVIEMKPRSGLLMWNSQSDAALGYGLSATPEQSAIVTGLIRNLKENPPEGKENLYLAAQISCCIDELFPSRSTTVALRTEYGMNYTDQKGTWLDPYNGDVRNYIAQLVQELYDMGFDEVILADVEHPVPPLVNNVQSVSFAYSREMSTTPNPVNAICGFAISVAQQLADRDGVLSIYCTKPQALVRADEETGQDARLFMKLYDRVYYPTDIYAYPYNVTDIESAVTIGDVHMRLVPVLTNFLFSADNDNASWVLVDQPSEGN